MDHFKEGTRQGIRFNTSKGMLSIEQLWSLNITDLDHLTVEADANYKESGKKSFIVKSSAKDKLAKLKFDILLDILTTKNDERLAALEKASDKEHDSKILRLIQEKEEDELKGKSAAQLRRMLKTS